MSFLRLFGSQVRSYRHLAIGDIPTSLFVQFNNQMYLTPRYQKISYTEDFLKYIKFLQRKKTVPYSQLRVFVQNLLTQYHTLMLQDRPEVNIKMQKNVHIPSSSSCQFHGAVDWMYSINGFNMTPVMHFHDKLNPFCGIAMALSNMHIRSFLKDQFQKQYKSHHKIYNHTNSYSGNNVWGYSIITTGHQWQLIRIDKNLRLEKSVVLEGNNKYRSMFHDEQMVTVLLGMLDYCLQLPEINVRVLEKAYQYIDQRKYMIQGKDEQQAKNSSLISKLLLNYYRKKL